MTHLYELYKHCPYCGSEYKNSDFSPTEINYSCSKCNQIFYQNSTPSATTIIPKQAEPNKIVLIERATEPSIGFLALPGGFLNYDEPPATAACRETLEETGIDIITNALLCTTLLDYLYLGNHVSVLEHAFITNPISLELTGIHTSEVRSIDYYDIDYILQHPERMAFKEHISVIEQYRTQLQ